MLLTCRGVWTENPSRAAWAQAAATFEKKKNGDDNVRGNNEELHAHENTHFWFPYLEF